MTLGLPLATIYAFLLVLARASGLVAFLPVPGFRNAPDPVRIVLALALTVAMFPVWPALPSNDPSLGTLTAWVVCEAGFGLAAGLAVAFLTEGFQLAAQVLGLQAGYGYAQAIDPNSLADSSVLQVFLSLTTGLLFFTLGIDHSLIRVLAESFQHFPAGAWTLTATSAEGVLKLGGAMLSTGLRLALPVTALLLLIDVALALMGRMQQQLQLLSLAFPVKMLAALGVLVALAPLIPKLFSAAAERTLSTLLRVVHGG
ncbi:MAG TPA: flagellar biosynthetic protein FliR [Bryobacteraceae bacterium]|nr:flagellar biosynthetic protein FliR [Bryobacteraceae bacterium]